MRAILFLALAFLPQAAVNENGAAPVPIKVSVCDLLSDPARYNHVLVQVSGVASHGFEDSNFSDTACPKSRYRLWMEYGGTRQTGTMSTASNFDRERPKSAVVEGIEVPLKEDETFRRFDDALHVKPSNPRDSVLVPATVIGTFFSGKPNFLGRPGLWGGYGHMGMSSLFLIQQVISVDSPAAATSNR